jgi:ferritin-like metal-binding protein YciE
MVSLAKNAQQVLGSSGSKVIYNLSLTAKEIAFHETKMTIISYRVLTTAAKKTKCKFLVKYK